MDKEKTNEAQPALQTGWWLIVSNSGAPQGPAFNSRDHAAICYGQMLVQERPFYSVVAVVPETSEHRPPEKWRGAWWFIVVHKEQGHAMTGARASRFRLSAKNQIPPGCEEHWKVIKVIAI